MTDKTLRDRAQRLVEEREAAAVERGEVVRLSDGSFVQADKLADATVVARAERAAWEAANLGPDGDYVALDEHRVVRKDIYDPQIHGPALSPRIVRCRYLRLSGEQCTAEAATTGYFSEGGDIYLCTKHLARAAELIRSAAAVAKVKAIL